MSINSLAPQQRRNTRASTANRINNGFHCVVCQKKPVLKNDETPEAHMSAHGNSFTRRERLTDNDINTLVQGDENKFPESLAGKFSLMRAIHESLQEQAPEKRAIDSDNEDAPLLQRRRVAKSPTRDSITVVTTEELSQQKKDLEQELQTSKDAFKALQEASQGQDATIKDLKDKISALRAETTTQDEKNTELTAQLTTTQEQMTEQSKTVSTLRASLAKAKRDVSTQQKRADKANEELDSAVGEHEQAYEALVQKLADYKAQAEAKLKNTQEELAKAKEGLDKISKGGVAFVINGHSLTPIEMYRNNVTLNQHIEKLKGVLQQRDSIISSLSQHIKELKDVLQQKNYILGPLSKDWQEEREGKLAAIKEAGYYHRKNKELTEQVEELTKKLNGKDGKDGKEMSRQEVASILDTLRNRTL